MRDAHDVGTLANGQQQGKHTTQFSSDTNVAECHSKPSNTFYTVGLSRITTSSAFPKS